MNIVNESSIEIPEKLIQRCIKQTRLYLFKDKNYSFAIVFVKSQKMRELNRKHHSADKVTDVLSFNSDEEEYIGEVVICPAFIKENYSVSRFEWELCHVVIHGILHLLGMHHEESEESHKKLHELEKNIIKKVLDK